MECLSFDTIKLGHEEPLVHTPHSDKERREG